MIGSALISGSYPALFLSSFKIVNIIKGITIPIKKSQSILKVRSILVVFQLFISIGLIIIVLFMFSQFRYIQNKDLGYNPENMICFSNSRSFENNIENIKNEILNHPAIESIAQGNNPSHSNYGTKVKWEGYTEQEGIQMSVLAVDEDYFDTYQINLKRGRGFSKEIATDKNEAIIINESAAKLLNFQDPVGQKISYRTPFEGFKEGTIIGVVKDFHTDPLYTNIQPLILNQETFWRYELGIRFNDKNKQENIVQFLDNIWTKYITDSPFEYYYFEDRLKSYYDNETKMFQIITSLTIIGIVISLLGILGLTYFTTEALTKEIGIRKVLGSSIKKLMMWLIKDISKWTVIAMIIAFPVVFYIIDKWVNNFAYHINISIWYFIAGGLITYLLVILISVMQIQKIAKLNPVESLRYE
jgi:putative ABC transport system permease protein